MYTDTIEFRKKGGQQDHVVDATEDGRVTERKGKVWMRSWCWSEISSLRACWLIHHHCSARVTPGEGWVWGRHELCVIIFPFFIMVYLVNFHFLFPAVPSFGIHGLVEEEGQGTKTEGGRYKTNNTEKEEPGLCMYGAWKRANTHMMDKWKSCGMDLVKVVSERKRAKHEISQCHVSVCAHHHMGCDTGVVWFAQ